MKLLAGLLILLAFQSCATAVPRTAGAGRQVPALENNDFPVPSTFLPLRRGLEAQPVPTPDSLNDWTRPNSALVLAQPVPSAVAMSLPQLPLPEVRSLPIKSTPASRSWTAVTQVQNTVPMIPEALPQAPDLKAAKPVSTQSSAQTAKTAAKPVAKTLSTVPAAAQPKGKAVAAPPPTAAAAANLLSADPTTAPDFHWQDINAVAGDAVTLHFDRTNWLYLDAPAQQKALGFLSITRDKDATTFQFKPMVAGQYTLEFQRQDLVNQTTDSRKVRLMVVPPGTRTSGTGTVLMPQTSTLAPGDALEASRKLSAEGKNAEAVQKLLQSYKADNTRVNLELARLLNQTGQDDQALDYLDKNLALPGPDFQSTLELGTKLAALRDPGKKLPTYVNLWTSGTTAPPEDLYVQVLEALRTQKLFVLAKDWSKRYSLWYPAPQFRDGYLYQLGQLLEEPGDGRNIQAAWKAYDEVVQNYPLSPYWKMSGERAAYLNRHFLQVR